MLSSPGLAAHRYQVELASTMSSSMKPRARSGAKARSPGRTGPLSDGGAGWAGAVDSRGSWVPRRRMSVVRWGRVRS